MFLGCCNTKDHEKPPDDVSGNVPIVLENDDPLAMSAMDHFGEDRFSVCFRYKQEPNTGTELESKLLGQQNEPIETKKFTEEIEEKLKKLDVAGWNQMLQVHSVQKLECTTPQYNPIRLCSDRSIHTWKGLVIVEISGSPAKVDRLRGKIAKAIESKEFSIDGFEEPIMVQEHSLGPLQDAGKNVKQAGIAAKHRQELNEATKKVDKLAAEVETYKAKLEEQKQKAIDDVTKKFLKTFEQPGQGEQDYAWKKMEEQQSLCDATIKMLVEDMKEFRKNEEQRNGTMLQALEDRKEWGAKIDQLTRDNDRLRKENKELETRFGGTGMGPSRTAQLS